jgi:hypothetical protein
MSEAQREELVRLLREGAELMPMDQKCRQQWFLRAMSALKKAEGR